MITGESVDTNSQIHDPLPPEPPTPEGGRSGWVRLLLAPLLVLSVMAHLALLFSPLPSGSGAEVEEEATEEEFVDLLSISSIAAPEPEAEPDLPSTPPPEAAPPPAAAAAPTQPIVPQVFPDTPPPEAAPLDAPPAVEPTFEPAPEPAPVFVQEEEVIEIFSRLTRGAGDSDFDSTATSFPAVAYLIRGGINEWSPTEQSCFFAQISADDYRLKPNAPSLRYLTRNEQFIRNEDVPRTFPPPQYQVSDLAGGYCNRPLYQVLREGQPYLFVSVAGIGVGAEGQRASGLVIIWSSDPRSS